MPARVVAGHATTPPSEWDKQRGKTMSETACTPFPTATARVGWTVRERGTGTIVGWVRRAEDADPCYGRPAGTFWRIPRDGYGDPANYQTVTEAAKAF